MAIISVIFFCANTFFVVRNELFDTNENEGDSQNRACAPVPDTEADTDALMWHGN